MLLSMFSLVSGDLDMPLARRQVVVIQQDHMVMH